MLALFYLGFAKTSLPGTFQQTDHPEPLHAAITLHPYQYSTKTYYQSCGGETRSMGSPGTDYMEYRELEQTTIPRVPNIERQMAVDQHYKCP